MFGDSMNIHNPDSWVIIKMIGLEPNGPDYFYKVLAGWSGGYLDGDSWRMNSGIDKIVDDGEYWNFVGASGSVYRCHKQGETMRMSMAGTWTQLKEKFPDNVELVKAEDIIPEFISD